MSPIYRFSGHSVVGFLQSGDAKWTAAPFARDIGEIMLELQQRGPIKLLEAWRSRRRYRQELRRLLRVGCHMITDIGLTLAEAQAEMDRPFWRA